MTEQKKKMGRPRKNPEGRDFRAVVYMDEPVKDDLYDLARITGLSASEYVYALIVKEANSRRDEIDALRRMRGGELPPLIF